MLHKRQAHKQHQMFN